MLCLIFRLNWVKKTSLRANGVASLLVKAQLKTHITNDIHVAVPFLSYRIVIVLVHCLSVKQALHRSSKMEFLEHGNEKPIVKVESLSNLEQMIRNGGIQNNLKSKTQSAYSNLAKQRICLHWHHALRLEMKLEIPA
ncbi:hypothetical protein AVEN_128729-1 [Araneus ventricosus]|uniref:Uncharacterized protein n=1 Tax=Araneus ventricosus TaxID=182803 RepID=A0A4Y2TBY4_ARAVE|nr:hypothetical protein AVEN_128729-1 [Araneus ventricosus]